MFQSLIGILSNCNLIAVGFTASAPQVSIPDRDFKQLQFDDDDTDRGGDVDVSIPDRDFKQLQSLAFETLTVFSFQGSDATDTIKSTISGDGL